MVKITERKSGYIKSISYEKNKQALSISAKNQEAFEFLSLRLKQIFSISGLDDNIDINFTYDCNEHNNSITFKTNITQALWFLSKQGVISKKTNTTLSKAIKCGSSKFFPEQRESQKSNPVKSNPLKIFLNQICK